ncbi:MAG: CaiB/BaiF CoA-transferase family protein [Desulfosarcinaceae bacterium]|nr:CaiB/BaiF CoA-transferase family protein [Desulfosarcinaceae bacterium]
MENRAELPLADIVVLELTHTVMGPTCGLVLADLGADVYKVEQTGSGDRTRDLKGFGTGLFTAFNRNKRSISIDLKTERGNMVFLKMLRHADVLIENFGPGTMARLGLDYPTCRARNEGLIYCSLKGFMPGPYEKRPALDEVVQMLGGLAYMTGPIGRPLRAGASVIDILAGSYGVIGILAALHQRQFTGQGRLVQASLFESVAFLMGPHLAVAAMTGEPPPPMPERGRTWSIYDLFDTADGQQLFIGVTSDRHWQRMCNVFGFTDWAADARLATNQLRVEARPWLLPALRRRLEAHTAGELARLAETAEIPHARINRPEDLLDDPHLKHSAGLADTLAPTGEMIPLPKIPLRFDRQPFELRRQPPAIGEGARDYFHRLGYSDEEIEHLRQAGIVDLFEER